MKGRFRLLTWIGLVFASFSLLVGALTNAFNSSAAIETRAASTSSLVFTAACGGSGTADNGAVWTLTSDADESVYESARGVHYGTSNAAVSYLRATTDDISGIITQIVVNASGASGTSAKLNVTVGGVAFDSQQSLTASATEYTLTDSGSGEIVVSITQNSAKKAVYLKSIVVTYAAQVVSLSTTELDGYPGDTTPAISVTGTPGFSGTPTYSWSLSNAHASFTSAPGSASSVTLDLISTGVVTLTCTATYSTEVATATVTVTVNKSVYYLSLSSEVLKLKPNSESTVIPTITGHGVYWEPATLTWSSALLSVFVNGEAATSGAEVESGDVVTFRSSASTGSATYTFTTYEDATTDGDEKTCTVTVSDDTYFRDTLTLSTTGVSSGAYTDWSGKNRAANPSDISSSASYSGNSTNNGDAIQFRSSNSSGIVSLTSGGRLLKVSVSWNSTTDAGRTLDIYATNTAYTSSGNLYNDAARGTKIGSLIKGTSSELSLSASSNYAYVGVRSNDKALYLDSISFDWDLADSLTVTSPTTSFEKGDNWSFGTSVMAHYSAVNDNFDVTSQVSIYLTDTSKNNPVALDTDHIMDVTEDDYWVKVCFESSGYTLVSYYQISVEYVDVESIVIDDGSIYILKRDGDHQFTATVTGINANPDVVWSISSTTLDAEEYGLNTSTGKLSLFAESDGKIVLRATTVGTDSGGNHIYDECTITVTDSRSVFLNKTSISAYSDDASQTITATPVNFTGDLTYTWTATKGGSAISLTNTNQATVTVNFLAAGSGTIQCLVSDGVGSASTTCSFTIANGSATLSWNSRGGVDGALVFYKGDAFSLNPGASLSVSFANSEVYEPEDLELSDSRLSLMIYDNDSVAVGDGREETISTYRFQRADDGKTIRIKFADEHGHVAYTTTGLAAHTLHIINWRTVTYTGPFTGGYDFSLTSLKSSVTANDQNTSPLYTEEMTLPKVSDVSNFYVGNKSGDGDVTETAVGRIGADKKNGTVTFTFPTGLTVNGITIEARGWNDDETPTISVTGGGDTFTVSSTIQSHTFTIASPTNTVTISSSGNDTTKYRAFIYSIDFSFASGSTNIGKTASCVGLESFIDTVMHFDDVDEDNNNDTNACRDSGAGALGYFSTANEAFEELSERQRALFMTHSAYTKERARFEAWAAANGKEVLLENGDYVVKPAAFIPKPFNKDQSPLTTTLWIVLASGLAGLGAIGVAYAISKRRKHDEVI